MKHLILLLGGILAVSAQAQLTTLGAKTNATPIPLLKATVTGTVEVVQQVTPGVTRVRTSILNNQRIFDEFAASTSDYALVFDAQLPGVLKLVPKSASAVLPTIEVFNLANAKFLTDSKLSVVEIFYTMSSTATGNLFEGLGGAIRGRLTYKISKLKKFTLSANSFGTNIDGANPLDLLKFKVVAAGDFTQKP